LKYFLHCFRNRPLRTVTLPNLVVLRNFEIDIAREWCKNEQSPRAYINAREKKLSLFIYVKMTEEEVAPIIVSPNYAGACEPTEAKQNHLLGLLKNSRYVSGSSLFALKYDVLPCILNADELFDTMDSISDDDDDDDDTSSDSGRSEGNRGRLRERQQLMYHTTRLVSKI